MRFLFIVLTVTLTSCHSKKIDKIVFPEGGYKYPDTIIPKDSGFCWYPIKDEMEPRDSLYAAYDGPYLYQAYQEKNLSLRPEGKAVFRFVYGGRAGIQPPIFITLLENEMIIKEGKNGDPLPYMDPDKLTEQEQWDLNLFYTYYPLLKKNTKASIRKNKFLDSVVSVRPELLTAEYYISLMEKGKTFSDKKFFYTTRKISISLDTYKKMIESINRSGYWAQSYQFPCNSHPADGSSYSLEANTHGKYNIVIIDDCDVNDSPIAKAYQQLIDLAGLKKKIHISGVTERVKSP